MGLKSLWEIFFGVVIGFEVIICIQIFHYLYNQTKISRITEPSRVEDNLAWKFGSYLTCFHILKSLYRRHYIRSGHILLVPATHKLRIGKRAVSVSDLYLFSEKSTRDQSRKKYILNENILVENHLLYETLLVKMSFFTIYFSCVLYSSP